MAQTYSPSDIEFALVPEVTTGTAPASGAQYRVPHVPGNSVSYTADSLTSPILTKGRQAGGSRKSGYRAEGSLKTHFNRSDFHDILLQAAFCGTWTEAGSVGEVGDILKASNKDTSLTIEKKVSGTPNLFSQYSGMHVSKFTLTCEADTNAEATWDFLGMSRVNSNSASARTYQDAENTLKLHGADVNTVSIGGLSGIQFRSLELSVEHTREALSAFGTTSAIGIGTSGSRVATLSLTFYRKDFTPETVLAGDNGVPVSFTIGQGAEGYTFTMANATAALPTEEEDGASYLVTVVFTASRDNTADTDIQVTRN